ncbi:alpha/beta hydrolase [Cytobacillus purgationiresistens]|uniref:Carboxylesterase n=1 Tax=Cytobacillus purgationiresistens TaxID=863449 RepID=A0ABU0AC64_9BACI|nr:alpha/beta fold hydrolase [Cytobacillus purgationiresistens]MDQ0268832.1 carboxylesterase [Cytobacillus purgationiresistens]
MEQSTRVIDGAESFFFDGNDTGILILHGFIGTPQSVRYIGDELAQLGYTVYAPRLAGHGTDYLDLEECTYHDWLHSAEIGLEKLRKHCKSIFILGQSMGGTLTILLAEKFKGIAGIILINTALSIPNLDYLKGNTIQQYVDEGTPDIKDKEADEIIYKKVPVKAIHEIQKLMDIAPASIKRIHCPLLCFKSLEDHVVPHENTDKIIKEVGSQDKEVKILQHSYHVATMDFEKDRIIEDSHLFIQTRVSAGYLEDRQKEEWRLQGKIGGREIG